MGLLVALAETRFPDAGREIDRAFKGVEIDSLVPAWVLFHRHPKGADFTVAETLLANKLGSPAARDWIKAQTQSWISAWHIALAANDRFSCRDLISGEIRVAVRADPRTRGLLANGDVFLGRIVDFEHGPEIFGVAPHTLSLRMAATVVERVLKALRTTQVTPARLRTHRGGFVVQREWNAVVKAARDR